MNQNINSDDALFNYWEKNLSLLSFFFCVLNFSGVPWDFFTYQKCAVAEKRSGNNALILCVMQCVKLLFQTFDQ